MGELKDVLLGMSAAACQWRERGVTGLPTLEREDWVIQSFDVLARRFAAQPPPVQDAISKRRGRHKQTSRKNLVDDLLRRADQVLVFLDDLSIPVTNTQAERDVRMVNVQQKIAGIFRREGGITAFCCIRGIWAPLAHKVKRCWQPWLRCSLTVHYPSPGTSTDST